MRHQARIRTLIVLVAILFATLSRTPLGLPPAYATGPVLPNPLLFVTQVPTTYDVLTTVTIFGNHLGTVHSAGRGGDLWLRLADGTLKNLTQLAGYGMGAGLQGSTSIAVRDPSVSWDGTKALFSMVVGAPTQATATPPDYHWQMYEVTNLGQVIANNATPVIQQVPNQPNYNNVSPIYGTNGRIIFISDAPRQGQAHLYPLLDEYNMRPTNTGLWSLDPSSGNIFHMDDSPSGNLATMVDSFGRVILIRWDHLERDQQFDLDAQRAQQGQACIFCTVNYTDESAQATYTATTPQNNPEVFPEPRPNTMWLSGTNFSGHHMNEFLPWQMNEDGSNAETINHVGRHELLSHIPPVFTDDPNLQALNGPQPGSASQYRVVSFLQIKEDPSVPGSYYGVNAKELAHGSGQIVKLVNATPSDNADQMAVQYITHHDTFSTTLPLQNASDGHYRDPLGLSDGTLVAAYTTFKNGEGPIPNQPVPPSQFDFRIYSLSMNQSIGYMAHNQLLTSGLPTKSVSYYDTTTLVQFTGQLWELQPVEVRARVKPSTLASPPLAQPELNAFSQAGVTPQQIQTFLSQNNLALIVSRNVTHRDDADTQQPLRLQVGTTGATAVPPGSSGKLYHINYLQLMQADQLRGIGASGQQPPAPGRRVIAKPMHDSVALQYDPASPVNAPGGVVLGQDGSMAAFVPARRAISWQLTDGAGVPVVRERVWVTMQPGEVRVCAACHGVNANDQTGAAGVPTNTPQALIDLLNHWKTITNTAPQLTNRTPASATSGGAAFTLTVTGVNFANDAVVLWNGSPRTTHFVSSTQLTADISASDIQAAGSATISVSNPSSGLVSNLLTFTIGDGPTYAAYLPLLTR